MAYIRTPVHDWSEAPGSRQERLDGFGLVTGRGVPAQDRRVLLMHGTTADRARAIVGRSAMAPGRAFFTLGTGDRDLARLFAHRASQRSPRAGPPALVIASMPEQAFERLRKLGLMRAIPFDAGDRPELRGRRQWILEPGGVEILNREVEDWRAVPLGRRIAAARGR